MEKELQKLWAMLAVVVGGRKNELPTGRGCATSFIISIGAPIATRLRFCWALKRLVLFESRRRPAPFNARRNVEGRWKIWWKRWRTRWLCWRRHPASNGPDLCRPTKLVAGPDCSISCAFYHSCVIECIMIERKVMIIFSCDLTFPFS